MQAKQPTTDDLPPLAEALFGAKGLDEAHAAMQSKMEAMSECLRVAVLSCDPKQLIGFLWGQLLMRQLGQGGEAGEANDPAGLDVLMFSLEYVHAALSSHATSEHGASAATVDLNAVLALASELRQHALMYCLVAARRMPESLFGPETGMVAMQALTSWVTIRGHRHQGLEAEFFEFVFEPHDEALRTAYGVGAREIAAGMQAAVDATRFGHMRATEVLEREVEAAYSLVEKEGIELSEAVQRIHGEKSERNQATQEAISGLFLGGICNLSKSSGLPAELLEDLAYVPGEETEFFAAGPLRGTPLRRMPGRVKPLVTLDDGHYACDANFMRDSAYRALQWGLLKRVPAYRQKWTDNQTALSEGAFSRIFEKQLAGAEVLTSVYYPDPDTGSWVENDVLVLLNDVLLQLEVKAGVMPMHSPDTFFERHVRTIQELVIKAHHQCERFLRYAASNEEVPLYQLVDGSHQEVGRLRLANYRVVVPIGLTVEAFTPFSSMSKRLPDVQPILGKYPFISMSIDDLFVLSRFLPTTGELMHYLSVRQGIAGVQEAFVFDEMDHLGSYVQKNRADMFYTEKLAEGANWLTEADACAPVDAYFANPDWAEVAPPHQVFPGVLQDFLAANDATRGPRFLEADSAVRDMGGDGRKDMARYIDQLLPTIQEHPYRWFVLMSEEPLLVWLQRADYVDAVEMHRIKAEAVALNSKAPHCKVLMMYITPDGTFAGGWARCVFAPSETDNRYAERLADAQRMETRSIPLTHEGVRRLNTRAF